MAAVNKPVYFNIEGDKDLLIFANSLPGFSTWVKDRIKEELKRQSATEYETLKKDVDKNSNGRSERGSSWIDSEKFSD